MASFESVVRRPVYLQVAEQLREAILDGTLVAGQPLPSERELTEQLGASRTSVREALRALQAQGLIVAAGPTAPLRVAAAENLSTGPVREALVHLMRLGRVPLTDLVQLRCALEAAIAEAAARRRPRPDLRAARHELQMMIGAGPDVEEFEQADVRFHLALSVASGNEALHLVMLAVRDSIAAHLLDHLRALPAPQPVLDRLIAEHEALLTAIERRDAVEAGERMRDHVLGFYDGRPG